MQVHQSIYIGLLAENDIQIRVMYLVHVHIHDLLCALYTFTQYLHSFYILCYNYCAYLTR